MSGKGKSKAAPSPAARSVTRAAKKNAGSSVASSSSSSSSLSSNKKRAVLLPTQRNKKKKLSPVQEELSKGQTKAKPKTKPKETTANRPPKCMSKDEDLLLARAHVNATENPVKGAGQKLKILWAQIKKNFDTLCLDKLGLVQERSQESLKNRWSRFIQKDVSCFNKCYKQSKDKCPSGKTEQDLIEDAMEKCLEIEGKPFKCGWEIVETLHQLPKFNPFHDNCGKGFDDEEENTKARTTNEVGKAMGQDLKRPIGRDQAKKLLKDAPTMASIETERNQAVAEVAAASREIASAMRLKEESDRTMRMVTACIQIGMPEKAKEVMEELDRSRKAHARTPVSELTEPPPVRDVAIPAASENAPETPQLETGKLLEQTEDGSSSSTDQEQFANFCKQLPSLNAEQLPPFNAQEDNDEEEEGDGDAVPV